MKRGRIRVTALTACVCVILLSTIAGTVVAAPKVVIRAAWGETIDPWSHPQSAYFNVFKYYVETLSNGRMSVTLHPAASLGTAPQVLDLLVKGVVQVCGSMPAGVVGSKYCPTLNALNIPYLFTDTQVMLDVLESPKILRHLNEKLDKAAGIQILSVISEGQRFLTNKVRPIRKPADLKGLKIRVMEGDIYAAAIKALGGSPVPIPWAELYTCLQTGVVDGQENPPMNIVYKALHEVQKYMTIPGPFAAPSAIYINSKFYRSLSEEDRQVIDRAATYAAQAHRGVFEVKDMEAKNLLQQRLEVYVLSPKELEEFKQACQPTILAMMDKLTGGDTEFVEMLLNEVKAAEQRLGIK